MPATVRGLKELDAALSALPDDMQRGPLRAGLRAGAAVVRDGMARRAPRDPIVEGTTLADEIRFGVKVNQRDGGRAEIGPSKRAYYGTFQELGTSKMRAHPFMRPTMDEDQDLIVSAFASELRRGILRAAARFARSIY